MKLDNRVTVLFLAPRSVRTARAVPGAMQHRLERGFDQGIAQSMPIDAYDAMPLTSFRLLHQPLQSPFGPKAWR